jgi:predicted secreted protein
VITQADTGKTFSLRTGSTALLQLGGGMSWREPVVMGQAVTLTPVALSGTPGYQQWHIQAIRPGQATIQSYGTIPCSPGRVCAQLVVAFQVTITVS